MNTVEKRRIKAIAMGTIEAAFMAASTSSDQPIKNRSIGNVQGTEIIRPPTLGCRSARIDWAAMKRPPTKKEVMTFRTNGSITISSISSSIANLKGRVCFSMDTHLYLRVQQKFNEVYSPDSFEVIAKNGIHTDDVFRYKFLLCKFFLHNYQKVFCMQEIYQNSCQSQV